MSEEEKAIETLKEVASDDFDTLGDDISPKMAQNILNLIEKQQKEIEYLNVIINSDEDNYINKDKIRKTIKDLENHRIMSSDDFTIKVLKDLLMEDNNERRRKKHSNE